MAKFDWKRFLVIGAGVLLSQQLLGSAISGAIPAVTQFGFGVITVANLVTVGAGIWVGEMVVEKWK